MKHGFTLLEILITLAISSIVLALSVIGVTSYLARQALNGSAQNLSILLERAQIQAGKGLPVCLDFSNINSTGMVRMFSFPNDTESAMAANGACSTATAGIVSLGETGVAKKGVRLASGGSCGTLTAAYGCVLWVRKDGLPIACANSSGCMSAVPSSGCTSVGVGVQFILSHSKLAPGAKAKEVEFTEAGLVHTPKLGNKGYLTTAWAAYDGDGGGNGSCQ